MTERGEQNKLTRHEEHLLERMNECGSGSHKGRRKNTTRRCGDFFRLLVLPLGLCFCEQSGGMTKTALPIRFKPAWGCVLLYFFSIFCKRNSPFLTKWAAKLTLILRYVCNVFFMSHSIKPLLSKIAINPSLLRGQLTKSRNSDLESLH